MKTKTKRILLKVFNLIIIMLVVLNMITALMGTGGISYGADGSDFFSNWISEFTSQGQGLTISVALLTLSAVAFHGIPLLIIMAIKLFAVVAGFVGLLLMSGVLARI